MRIKRTEQWYLYDYCERFLEEINFVYETYNNKAKKIYGNPDKEADNYMKYLQMNTSELKSHSFEDADIEIQSRTYRRYLLVRNMKYRVLAMYINLTYQMLEQFLISIIKNQFIISLDKEYVKKTKIKGLDDIVNVFMKYNCDLKSFDTFDKINELRLLQNVLKHGNGKAKEELKKINYKYFQTGFSSGDLSSMFNETIINDNINISDDDLKNFVNSINQFLNKIPNILQYDFYIER